VADLARLHELGQVAGGLLDGDGAIGPVHLVEVDVVDTQRPQRILDTGLQRGATGVARHATIAAAQPTLRGDHDFVPVSA
jgi:hypothetical protein